MRCYNGCPDAELQAVIDAKQAAKDEARRLGMVITYFPAEGQWMTFDLDDYRELSRFHNHPQQALDEAKKREGIV